MTRLSARLHDAISRFIMGMMWATNRLVEIQVHFSSLPDPRNTDEAILDLLFGRDKPKKGDATIRESLKKYRTFWESLESRLCYLEIPITPAGTSNA